MEELWKDIEGYEGKYQISNMGRLKALAKPSKGYGYKYAVDRIIKPVKCTNGYYEAQLHVNGKTKIFLMHRLVAKHFIPNPDNLPQVNHKDEDISNNRVDNLEWCTPKYNANYGARNEKCREGNRRFFKPVYQIDKDCRMVIRWWECTNDAAKKLNICPEQIARVCKGKNITAGGFIWRYADEYDKEQAI